MRDLAALIVPIAMFGMGYIVAADVSSGRHNEAQDASQLIAANNVTLRQTIKTLRQSCPTRPRLSRSPYHPGDAI